MQKELYCNIGKHVLRQPLFLLVTENYQKIEMMQHGISHFYTFQANGADFDLARVVPDGCNDIMFVRSKERRYATYVGTPLDSKPIEHYHYFQKGDEVFGVRFLQGNLTWMNKCSAHDLLDQALPFKEVSNMQEMLMEKIFQCNDFHEQIRIFLQAYLPEYELYRQKIAGSNEIVYHTLQSIVTSGGEIRIKALAERAAYSVRHLNELFRSTYGLSPKEFERIVRFQNSLSIVEHCSRISDAAIEAGYYDQSHMLKEYKSFLGISPKEYLRKRKQTVQHQTLHIEQMSASHILSVSCEPGGKDYAVIDPHPI